MYHRNPKKNFLTRGTGKLNHSSSEITGPVPVFIPAYNEEETIGEVIASLKNLNVDLIIYVVDDGSQDGTFEKARNAGAIVIRHPMNLGGGAAIKTAFMVALKKNYNFIVTMDADGQHEPADLPNLLQAVKTADFVIGSRFMNRKRPEMPAYRLVGVIFMSWLLRKIIKIELTDATSCYRVYKLSIIRKMLPYLRENQYYALETLILAKKFDAIITEVPITNRLRKKGYSKKGSFKYGFNLMKVILRNFFRSIS